MRGALQACASTPHHLHHLRSAGRASRPPLPHSPGREDAPGGRRPPGVSFRAAGARVRCTRGGAVGRWVLERKGLVGVRAGHPLSSAPSLISVSITHLSNRLFLELDFIIRALQSFRLLRPKHTPLPPAPKCVSVNRRRSDPYRVPPLCTSGPWQALTGGNMRTIFKRARQWFRIITDKAFYSEF